MTARALALSDSVDGLLDSLAAHMTEAMAADTDADVRALEGDHYSATLARLDRIDGAIRKLEECADADGVQPRTAALWQLHDDAWGEAAGHLLLVAFTENLDIARYHRDELSYQISMTDTMGDFRGQPIFEPDVTASYFCPADCVDQFCEALPDMPQLDPEDFVTPMPDPTAHIGTPPHTTTADFITPDPTAHVGTVAHTLGN